MTSFLEEVKNWPDWKRDAFEERAAMIEYGDQVSRAKAEFRAYRDIQAKEDSDGN
ncbi:MAG: hypothetical protein VX529_06485 [Pseudomonadota bacterium]|nr:hypothetical protein [Pseudomonadota bacterium]